MILLLIPNCKTNRGFKTRYKLEKSSPVWNGRSVEEDYANADPPTSKSESMKQSRVSLIAAVSCRQQPGDVDACRAGRMAAETPLCSSCCQQVTAHWDQSVTRCDHDGWRCQPSGTTLLSHTHVRRYTHCRGSRQEKSQEETKGRTEGDARSDSLTKIEVRRETERAVIATC